MLCNARVFIGGSGFKQDQKQDYESSAHDPTIMMYWREFSKSREVVLLPKGVLNYYKLLLTKEVNQNKMYEALPSIQQDIL